MKHRPASGFTLIELSIVLVIIGLIVGSILTGQDLIKAASLRAQLAQIEKYNTAVHTFQGKYGGLPGDLALNLATQFAFQTGGCGGGAGARDGNGYIEGYFGGYPNNNDEFLGETGMFWEDLSAAVLVDGSFPNGGGAARNCTQDSTVITLSPGAYAVSDFIPGARVGNGNYVYVYTALGAIQASYPVNTNNWFGVSQVTGTATNGWSMQSNPGISVLDAYNMDKKMDDGLPTKGNVVAYYNSFNGLYPSANAVTASGATCFDTTTFVYSTAAAANILNCGLSFLMQ